MVSEPPDLRTDRCAGPQMLIWPPSTRSMRAAPDMTRTALPLRRTVFAWPWTTSTLMGPLTVIASPSMTPTESEGGSSGRAAVAASSAAQRLAMKAAGTAARRRHSNELEKAVTGDTPRHGGRKSRLYYTSAALHPHAEDDDDTRNSRRGHKEIRRGTRECALRHTAA